MTPKKTILNYLDAGISALFFVFFVVLSVLLKPFILLGTAVGAIMSSNEKVDRYAKNVWLGFDNSASADTGGHWEDTLSSRLGKAQEAGSRVLSFIARRVDNLWFVMLNQQGHCKKAIELRNNNKQVTGR